VADKTTSEAEADSRSDQPARSLTAPEHDPRGPDWSATGATARMAPEHDPRGDVPLRAASGPTTVSQTEVEPPEPERDTSEQSAATQPAGGLPAPAPAPEKRRGGGFAGAVIGGIIAAALGFLAARSDMLDQFLPPDWRSVDYAVEIEGLRQADAAQGETLSQLESNLAGIEIPDTAPLDQRLIELAERLDGIDARLSELAQVQEGLTGRLDPLDQRLTELEKQPFDEAVSEAAIAAYERELAGLEEAVTAQRAEVERLLEEARAKEDAAREAEAQAAEAAQVAALRTTLAQLRAALDEGAPYDTLTGALRDAGIEVPEDLAAPAAEGVVTLSALRARFPDAAREALAQARATGEGGGLGAFLTRQLGARSVAPREGDDPDAILSRAEDALTRGDLAGALDEIAALPEAARAEMDGWAGPARTRLAAVQAADTLAQSLNSN